MELFTLIALLGLLSKEEHLINLIKCLIDKGFLLEGSQLPESQLM